MKIRVFDIKLNDRSFTESAKFKMYVPSDDCSNDMIEWMQEFNELDCSIESALHVFIRTTILYGATKLDYKMQFVFNNEKEATATDQILMADIIDQNYTSYKLINFDLQLPSEVIVDTDDLMFTNYQSDTDTIEQVVFELLLNTLKFNVSNITQL